MTGEAVIRALRATGLSLYEARVYLGLLQHGPQNGNELSKSAGVPSSKVYALLDKLTREGIVHAMKNGATTEFVCVSPRDLIQRLRQQFNEPLDFLEDTLPSLSTFEPASEVFSMVGLAPILENARYLVNGAERELDVSLWRPEFELLTDALETADARGVRLYGMLYGPSSSPPFGNWLVHSYQEIVASRIKGRILVITADHDEALVAHLPDGGEPSGVRTRSPALALITLEYLHHDYVLQRAQQSIGFEEWDRYWQADPDLRARILGESLG
jgi:sugar-specific transcriptional regulator TrmB